MRIRRHRIYVRFGFMFMFDCNLNTLQRIMFVALTCFVNVCKKKISFMFNVWDVRGFMSVFLICCYCFCSLFGYFFNVVLMLLSCFFSLLTAPATWHYLETIEKAFSQHPKLLIRFVDQLHDPPSPSLPLSQAYFALSIGPTHHRP